MHLGAVTSETKTGLSAEIDALRKKAVVFMSAFSDLERKRPDPAKYPAEYKRWTELKAYGDKTKAAIARITGFVDTAGNVADSLYYGLTHPFGYDPFNLGFIPLIPAAGVAITGAIIASTMAAMTYFITEAYEYGKFAESSPEVRAALTKRAEGTGIASGVKGILGSATGLLVVAAIILIVPKLIAMRGKK